MTQLVPKTNAKLIKITLFTAYKAKLNLNHLLTKQQQSKSEDWSGKAMKDRL